SVDPEHIAGHMLPGAGSTYGSIDPWGVSHEHDMALSGTPLHDLLRFGEHRGRRVTRTGDEDLHGTPPGERGVRRDPPPGHELLQSEEIPSMPTSRAAAVAEGKTTTLTAGTEIPRLPTRRFQVLSAGATKLALGRISARMERHREATETQDSHHGLLS